MIHNSFGRGPLTILLAVATLLMAWPANAAITVSSHLRGKDDSTQITWVSITISNPMSVESRCQVVLRGFSSRGGNGEVRQSLAPIPPGASRTVNIPVPIMDSISGTVYEQGATDVHLNFTSGWNSRRTVVHVAPQGNHLTEDQLNEFTLRENPEIKSRYSYSTGTTTPTLSESDRLVTQMTPDTLPENWLCYVPLQAAIINEQVEKALTAPQKDALDTWVRTGGRVIYYGSTVTDEKKVGLGRVERLQGNPLASTNFRLEPEGGATGLARQNLQGVSMPYIQNRAGGRNGALALATLFLIVAGPVNYIYFSRRGQIRKIIFTLPLISIFFCGIIAVYFVLTQGLQRKGGSMSVTIVDESANKGFTAARHSLLSGLYPLGGFQFSPVTYFLPNAADSSRVEADFDLTNTQNLTDGLFQPGIPFNYATLTPFTTRERMLYDAEKSTLRNGFELPVKAAVVYNDGRYYLGGAAPSGGEVKLELVDSARVPKVDVGAQQLHMVSPMIRLMGEQKLTTQELDDLVNLANFITNTDTMSSGPVYGVLLNGLPKSSDSGVVITEGDNLHLMMGSLNTGGEGAK